MMIMSLSIRLKLFVKAEAQIKDEAVRFYLSQAAHADADYETHLTPYDFERANHIDNIHHENAHELENNLYRWNRFEGDIVFKPHLPKKLSAANGVFFNAVVDQTRIWTRGVVPYTVSSRFGPDARSLIASVVKDFNVRSCVRFEPKTMDDEDYLHLMPDDGCYSSVGRTGGKQILSLGHGCLNRGVMMHEFLHALGFFHEQSRNDRDNFVNIVWHNIAEGMEDQFHKFGTSTVQNLGPYDYDSIMHYGPRAFSRNGRSTIVPLKPNVRIGQRKGFSDLDLQKLTILYGCGGDPRINSEKISSEIVDHISTPANQKLNGTCQDLKSECRMLKIMGFCKSFRHWMSVNCRSTCRFCRRRADNESGENPGSSGNSEVDCADHNGSVCAFWEYAGLCEEFRDFASKHCRKSCKMCYTS